MVYGMAYRAWHGIWYGLEGMAGYMVWLAGMAWYGVAGMSLFMVWPGGHGMVFRMAWEGHGVVYGICWVDMACYMV